MNEQKIMKRMDQLFEDFSFESLARLKKKALRILRNLPKDHGFDPIVLVFEAILADYQSLDLRDEQSRLKQTIVKRFSVDFEDRIIDMLTLKDAIRQLHREHPSYCQCIVSYYYMGKTYDEVASEFNLSVHQVRSALEKAKVFLKSHLSEPIPKVGKC